MFLDMVSLAVREKPETGTTVTCRPDLFDPSVVERQHRAVCLTKPYAACQSCQNSSFKLVFKEKERQEQVLCPRWESEATRMKGEAPSQYKVTEVATCQSKPFPFCSSCPSRTELTEKYSADKTKEGWYGRWKRLRQMEFEDE